LPIIGRQALHGGIEGELALETIQNHSKGDLTGIDDGLGDDEAFPEVRWLSHFGREFAEHHGSAIGIDSLIEAVKSRHKCSSWWRS
jgi:hypothetical protein